MSLRHSTLGDSGPIVDVWNAVICDNPFTFNSVEKSPEDFNTLLIDKVALNQPVFVTEIDGKIVVFATYG
jgi:L-amino acid N-acyltransferase YncA